MSAPAIPTPAARDDICERFLRLAAEWKQQSRYLSNTAQMAMFTPYQRSIGMGSPAVPLIRWDFADADDHAEVLAEIVAGLLGACSDPPAGPTLPRYSFA